jgi:hypothetical protein
MKPDRGFLSSTNHQADKKQFNFRLQNFISALGLPLFALYIAVSYGHFLWGDFYRNWLWLLSISFIMQSGSVQMLSGLVQEHKLEELQEGFRARMVLIIIICLMLFFLPLPPANILVMLLFLIFRFAGDSLLSYQSSFGNGSRTLRAEMIFWLTLLLCLLLFRETISTAMLMQFVTVASLTRLIAADISLFKYLIGRGSHAPDTEWFRTALLKFMPVISVFLFYYTDMLLASIFLSATEFSQYQITMLYILFPVIIFSTINNSFSWNTVKYIFWLTGMLIMAILSYFILTRYAAIPLTGSYLIFALSMGVTGIIVNHYLLLISQSRNYSNLHLITFGTTVFYLVTFPLVLRTGVFENYFIYQTLVGILLSGVCWLIARNNLNKGVRLV